VVLTSTIFTENSIHCDRDG